MEHLHQDLFKNGEPTIYKELPYIDSGEIEKWLREKIFTSGFIFYDKKKNEAICSVCCKKFLVPEYATHNKSGKCPKCNASINYKSSGYKRDSLTQRIRLLLFQSNGRDLYATVNMIYLDFNNEYGKLYKDCEAVYKFNREYQEGYYTSYSTWWGGSWNTMKNIHVPQRCGDWQYAQLVIYDANMNEVFKNTDLKYCQIEQQINQWDIKELIKIINLNAKYEAIEKLHKAGLDAIIEDKMYQRPGSQAIKWHKDNIKEILNLNRDEIEKIKDLKYGLTEIYIYKTLIKEKFKINIENAADYDFTDIYRIRSIKAGTFKQRWKYLNKQLKVIKQQKQYKYYNLYSLVNEYSDYIKECKQLKFNMRDKMIIYPKNLIEAHIRTSMQVEVLVNKEKDESLQKIAIGYKNLNYQSKKLLIRVAESATEIIQEGKILRHCVGGYIDDVIKEKTLILLVRKISEPDIPYYTLELKKKSIRQCMGQGHCVMTEDIKAFVNKWHKEIVMKKDKSTNTKQKTKKVKVKEVA